jgi:hypothetical protein
MQASAKYLYSNEIRKLITRKLNNYSYIMKMISIFIVLLLISFVFTKNKSRCYPTADKKGTAMYYSARALGMPYFQSVNDDKYMKKLVDRYNIDESGYVTFKHVDLFGKDIDSEIFDRGNKVTVQLREFDNGWLLIVYNETYFEKYYFDFFEEMAKCLDVLKQFTNLNK